MREQYYDPRNFRNFIVLAIIFFVALTAVAEAQISGSFTIDPSGAGDYLNIQEAINELESEGINGAVILQFTSGTHTVNEVVVGYIDGMSSENSLTIRSQTENAEDVTLEGDGAFVIRIQGTATNPVEDVTLEHLTINNSDGFTVLEVQGEVAGIRIAENRLFGMPTTANLVTRSLIHAFDLSGAGLHIERNLMEDNSRGIHAQSASSGNPFRDLHIDGNHIGNVSSGNVLHTIESAQVINNRVQVNNNDALQLNSPRGNETLVANNVLISDIATVVQTIGAPVQPVRFYHNTMVARGGGLPSEVLRVTQTAHDIRNNIIFSASLSKAYFDQNNASQWSHNNLYTTGPYLGQFGSSNNPDNIGFTLADLVAKTGSHQNSFGLFPALDPENDYRSNSPFLDQAGGDLTAIVATDIDGNPRSSTPSIGAFEYTSTVTPIDGGTYTVGNGGDFSSPAAMIDAIHERGLTDDVTYEILPGTYPVGRSLHVVPPATGEEHVTIRSQSGNPEDVILEGVADVEHVLNLYGTRFVTIEDLTFDARELTTSSRHALGMNGGVSDITIRGNRILGDEGAFQENRNLITGSAVFQNNYLFENNDFVGGYYAVRLNTHTGGQLTAENLIFRRNRVESFGGVRIQSFDGAVIEKNVIHADRPISLSHMNRTPQAAEAETRAIIANNQIASRTEGGNQVYGIWLISSEAVDLLHNTVRILKNAASQGVIDINNTIDVDFANNIITVETPATTNPIYRISGNTSDLRSDHNHFFGLMDNKFRVGSTNYVTLDDFQTATEYETSSSFGEVSFISDDELRLAAHSESDPALTGTGQFLSLVPDDIGDLLRSDPPTKGAYEVDGVLPNNPPFFTEVLPDTIIRETESITFQFEADDPDGDPLFFSLIDGDDVDHSSITQNGFFTFAPVVGQAGSYSFTVRVSDGELHADATFNVTVNTEQNNPPFFTAAMTDTTLLEGTTLSFQFEAEDPDQDVLTYSLAAGSEIDNTVLTTEGLFTFAPEGSQAGSYDFTVRVSDGDLHADTTFMVLVVAPPIELRRIYVNHSAGNDAFNGASWENAVATLHRGLDLVTPGVTEEIWVTEGTYYPTDDPDNRTARFILTSGLGVYGGFSGNEESLDARDWLEHVTILSGDINQTGELEGNSHHVVDASGTDSITVLDGFIITKGYANQLVPDTPEPHFFGSRGGGVRIINGSPVLRNLIIRENYAIYGAGVHVYNGSPLLEYVQIVNNEGDMGAGMYSSEQQFFGSEIILKHVMFQDNWAWGQGGGYRKHRGEAVLSDVVFRNNRSTNGGGLKNDMDALKMSNVIFLNNSSVFMNISAGHGGGLNHENGSLILTNALFAGNSSSGNGGGLYIRSVYGERFITNITVAENESERDGGGIYIRAGTNQLPFPVFSNIILWDNEAGELGSEIRNATSITIGSEITISHSLIKGGLDGPGVYTEDGAQVDAIATINDGGGNIDGDPLFMDPAIGDFSLSPESPAIRAGTNVPFHLGEAASGIQKDLAGRMRISGGIVDMGAYEFPRPAVTTVKTFNQNNTREDVEGSRLSFEFTGIPDQQSLQILVEYIEEQPDNMEFSNGLPDKILDQHWIINSLGGVFETATLYLNDISEMPDADNPEELTIYSRAVPGRGEFTPLVDVEYEIDLDALKVQLPGFSEFIIATKGSVVSTDNPADELPVEFSLAQNYPNPFNPSTNITFGLPQAAEVRLEIFDILGRRVATLILGELEPGNHTAVFDAAALSSGMYIYRLTAHDLNGNNRQVFVRKMMLVR